MKKLALALLFLILFSHCGRKPQGLKYIRVALENSPLSLDPRVGTDQASQRLHQVLFRGLVRREKDGSLAPDLAETFWREGETKFVFKIKRGIRFCNGKEITPADVAYTYTSLLSGSIKSIRKGALWMVKDVKVQGRRVIFELRKPYSSFLINATLGIVPQGAGKEFSSHPIGSGPYCVKRAERDEILLLPNPYQKVKNKGVLIRIIPDEVTRALELEGGGIDLVVNGFSPDTLFELSKKENLRIKRTVGGNFAYLGLNLRDRYLRDRRVRLAIGYGIDRKSIIKNLLRGYATPADTVLPPYLPWHEKDVFSFHYSPQKSIKLLQEANLSSLSLEFKCASRRLSRQLAQVLKYQLGKVGINLKVSCGEFSYFYSQILQGNFQLYFLMWVGISDPDIFRFIYHSGSVPPHGANRGGYKNPAVDRLIEEGEATYDPEKRREIYSQIQKIVARDVVYIPLWYPDSVAVFRKGLKGVVVYPNGDLTFLPKLYFSP